MRRFIVCLAVVLLLVSGIGEAQALIIGTPDPSDGNYFPFGGVTYAACTRYQQVYDSSSFASTMTIGAIAFFQTELVGGNLNSGTYTLSLSTTAKTVNGLDLVTFDNNLGADNQLFTVDVLTGGPALAELVFVGTPFTYDPVLGNLLLDIQIAGISHTGAKAYYDAMNGTSGGLFSRAHDFDYGFYNYGLVTDFRAVPEPATIFLLGTGLVGLAVFRRKFRKS